MIEAVNLDVNLHGDRIGTIAKLDGDRSIFAFDDGYAADQERMTLSLAYKDSFGALINQPRAYQTRIEPFFSNLLPEGTLRDYLARRTGVKAVREYQLLGQLGADLPGAVEVIPPGGETVEQDEEESADVAEQARHALRFSLAGVQLKFSAIKNQGKGAGLTIPVGGSGGDWIIKLPSARHPDVPENEFATMNLAAALGIEVPETSLIPISDVGGLPEGIGRFGESAYAIRRFDRSTEGAIHIEDFAQVFGVFADGKYDNASYRQILSVLAIETDERSIVEFIRRLTYCVLIGNGDMHLKNWSLIYPDGRRPTLSPAYDLVATVAYVPEEESALKFHRSRDWRSFNYKELELIADRAKVPTRLVLTTAKETVEQFDDLWACKKGNLPFSRNTLTAIEKHRKSLAI